MITRERLVEATQLTQDEITTLIKEASSFLKRVLIIVDVQNDFVEGGSLAVLGGTALAAELAAWVGKNVDDYDYIIITQDWHIAPGEHWAPEGTAPDFNVSWPVHCAADAKGSELVPAIQKIEGLANFRIRKGMFEAAYSGFEGEVFDATDVATQNPKPFDFNLATLLWRLHVRFVDVVGIALDYCVLQTAMLSQHAGFDTRVFQNLTVGVAPESSDKAVATLLQNGITVQDAELVA